MHTHKRKSNTGISRDDLTAATWPLRALLPGILTTPPGEGAATVAHAAAVEWGGRRGKPPSRRDLR